MGALAGTILSLETADRSQRFGRATWTSPVVGRLGTGKPVGPIIPNDEDELAGICAVTEPRGVTPPTEPDWTGGDSGDAFVHVSPDEAVAVSKFVPKAESGGFDATTGETAGPCGSNAGGGGAGG